MRGNDATDFSNAESMRSHSSSAMVWLMDPKSTLFWSWRDAVDDSMGGVVVSAAAAAGWLSVDAMVKLMLVVLFCVFVQNEVGDDLTGKLEQAMVHILTDEGQKNIVTL